jgi:hypothetical protein
LPSILKRLASRSSCLEARSSFEGCADDACDCRAAALLSERSSGMPAALREPSLSAASPVFSDALALLPPAASLLFESPFASLASSLLALCVLSRGSFLIRSDANDRVGFAVTSLPSSEGDMGSSSSAPPPPDSSASPPAPAAAAAAAAALAAAAAAFLAAASA